jgi:hypothetical protein
MPGELLPDLEQRRHAAAKMLCFVGGILEGVERMLPYYTAVGALGSLYNGVESGFAPDPSVTTAISHSLGAGGIAGAGLVACAFIGALKEGAYHWAADFRSEL